ncbi:hypothetical protein CH063_00875, partial [Colletotrichum higginsianum]
LHNTTHVVGQIKADGPQKFLLFFPSITKQEANINSGWSFARQNRGSDAPQRRIPSGNCYHDEVLFRLSRPGVSWGASDPAALTVCSPTLPTYLPIPVLQDDTGLIPICIDILLNDHLFTLKILNRHNIKKLAFTSSFGLEHFTNETTQVQFNNYSRGSLKII